jgi:mitogen-activated protein kinase 1/3
LQNEDTGHVDTWKVGGRYQLIALLGCGSFGAVCKALDKRTGRIVALKRVPDALQTVDAARRVLREVVVLNRLDHPNIIKIFSIFHTPATSGARVLDPDTFTLKPVSVDLYAVFEYATGGDLYGLRGDTSAEEVRSLMHQLSSAVKYLHDCGVWHRDIKSANILCGRNRLGGRVVKVCDFGLARGGRSESQRPRVNDMSWDGEGDGDIGNDDDEVSFFGRRAKKRRNRGSHSRSGSMSFAKSPAKSFAERDMLTGVVATPCYRAPEVIMSEGKYTGAMDVWALGCIFGELLQRQSCGAHTPQLTISPLFRFDDDPLLPPPGSAEMYTNYLANRNLKPVSDTSHTHTNGVGDEMNGRRMSTSSSDESDEAMDADDAERKTFAESRIRARLNLFFDVIGTPSWTDVDAVSSERWRRYLRGIRGRPGNILSRFTAGRVGDVATDLLLRMLTFDPRRRASPDEILAHEYFAGFAPRGSSLGVVTRVVDTAMLDVATVAAEASGGTQHGEGSKTSGASRSDFAVDSNFWEVSEPRAALASLELAFARVKARTGDASTEGSSAWRDVFRELITKECERHTRSEVDYENGASDDENERDSGHLTGHESSPSFRAAERALSAGTGNKKVPFLSEAFPLFFRPESRPVAYTGTEEMGGLVDASVPDRDRADRVDFESRYLSGAPGTTGVYGHGGVGIGFGSSAGRRIRVKAQDEGGMVTDELCDPGLIGALQHLGLNRHGEWGELDLPTAQKKGVSFGGEEIVEIPGTWGVSATPPGMTREEGDSFHSLSNMQSR